MSKTDAVRRLAELTPSLQLTGLEDRALLELSGGQRRRFDIGLGLMHSPEPGLPRRADRRASTRRAGPTSGSTSAACATRFGLTVVLTTHYLEEADALADRILVMDHGQIIANDTADALKASISGDVVKLTLVDGGQSGRALEVARSVIEVRGWFEYEPQLHLTVEKGDVAVPVLLRALDAAGVPVQAVEVSRPSLDDVFLKLTGRDLREDARTPGESPEPAAVAAAATTTPSSTPTSTSRGA